MGTLCKVKEVLKKQSFYDKLKECYCSFALRKKMSNTWFKREENMKVISVMGENKTKTDFFYKKGTLMDITKCKGNS